jgi:hypothetical protein
MAHHEDNPFWSDPERQRVFFDADERTGWQRRFFTSDDRSTPAGSHQPTTTLRAR